MNRRFKVIPQSSLILRKQWNIDPDIVKSLMIKYDQSKCFKSKIIKSQIFNSNKKYTPKSKAFKHKQLTSTLFEPDNRPVEVRSSHNKLTNIYVSMEIDRFPFPGLTGFFVTER